MKNKKIHPVAIKTLVILMCIFIFSFSFKIIFPEYSLAINVTRSIKGFIFIINKNEMPNINNIAAFRAPKNSLENRFTFIKIIKGVSGDIVTVENNKDFFINGIYVGSAKKNSNNQKKLIPSSAGIIPKNYYFMSGTNVFSFDSRYKQIGLINEKNIIGRAYRVF